MCGLTLELSGRQRCGAWPAGCMMYHCGLRAKCHAGGSPLERLVRHRLTVQRLRLDCSRASSGPDNDEIPLRAETAATSELLFALPCFFDSVTLRLPPESTAVVEAMRPGASRLEPDPHCWQARPNVRGKRATTAGRQARAGDNVPRTASSGLVACRRRSA